MTHEWLSYDDLVVFARQAVGPEEALRWADRERESERKRKHRRLRSYCYRSLDVTVAVAYWRLTIFQVRTMARDGQLAREIRAGQKGVRLIRAVADGVDRYAKAWESRRARYGPTGSRSKSTDSAG